MAFFAELARRVKNKSNKLFGAISFKENTQFGYFICKKLVLYRLPKSVLARI